MAALIDRTAGASRDEALPSDRYGRDPKGTPNPGLPIPIRHRRRCLRTGHKEGYLGLAAGVLLAREQRRLAAIVTADMVGYSHAAYEQIYYSSLMPRTYLCARLLETLD
jgi:hypothetical protein